EPLRKAYVGLEDKESNSAVTDDKGRFAIEKIEPAGYTIEAERPGFLRNVVRLNLVPGQTLSDVAIALTPEASIAGRVLDDDGDLWNHANVNLYRSVRKQGRRQLEYQAGGDVDDRGEFRIADLQPGKYYLVAAPDNAWQSKFRSVRSDGLLLQPTWYPGSLDIEAATPVTLPAGRELAGIEIRLRRGAVRNIKGHLEGLSQIPKLADQGAYGKPRIFVSRPSVAEGTNYPSTLQPDGSFEVKGVPPGSYQINVAEGFLHHTILGITSVQVDDRDVDQVVIDVQPPRSLKGKVTLEGNTALKVSELPITISNDSPEDATVVPQEDGSFVVDQLGLEPYHVYANGKRNEDVYLKTVRFGDIESQDGSFSLTGRGDGRLELVISTRGARVTGTVQQSSTAAANRTSQVVLIPDTNDVEERDPLTRQEAVDQNGAFTIHAIPPGSYSLYAAEDVPDDAWSYPDFLQEVAGKGMKLQLGEGETKNIDVPVLSKASLAPLLSRLGIE
ncbi:MAG: carboxypeptidase regulatory-like domain-containing protein, partial [Bryobacteraceae bacterium]